MMRPSSAVVALAAAFALLVGCNGGGASGPGGPPTPMPTVTPTATPTPAANPSGAWMYGVDASSNKALLHVDAGLATLAEITGSNTQLDVNSGLATDAAANVYALRGAVVNMYPPTASGNAAPTSSTTMTLPANAQFASKLAGLALDGNGGAFVGLYHNSSPDCEILHVQLTGSTANAVMVADCTAFAAGNSSTVTRLATDTRGFLYAGFYGQLFAPPTQAPVVRYTIGPGGTLAYDSTVVVPNQGFAPLGALFDVDTHGNLFVSPDNGNIQFYPASTFVSGQQTTLPRTGSDTFPGTWPLGVDANGNLFAQKAFSASGVVVVPSGSHTASAPNAFTASLIAGVRRP